MNHKLASLLHCLAGFHDDEDHRIILLDHIDVMFDAISLGYTEPASKNSHLDLYWQRLTEKGKELVRESLNAMEAVS